MILLTPVQFIRQILAKILVYMKPEWGGILHDYKNGKWEQLLQWSDEEGALQSLRLIDNMILCGRDAIYIACIKVGPGRGFFFIIASDGRVWSRAFWDTLYPANAAFLEICKIARKKADTMGFRRPDETEVQELT